VIVTATLWRFVPSMTGGVWIGQWLTGENWDLATGATIMATLVFVGALFYDLRGLAPEREEA
jgi:hypothetical protein